MKGLFEDDCDWKNKENKVRERDWGNQSTYVARSFDSYNSITGTTILVSEGF